MVLTGGAATVVVTGADGFIGTALTAHLRGAGHPVRGLVRRLTTATAARADYVPLGDLTTCDDLALESVLRDAAAVVHLAACVHRPRAEGAADAEAMRQVNVEATLRLARAAAAAGVAHFVFASTVKVNGEMTLPGRPFRESDPPAPRDAYAASKHHAEQALAALAEATGLRVTVLRLPLTYGPGAKANFAALARAVRRGVPLPLAAIDNRRSLLGVGNLGAAVATLLADAGAADRGRMSPYLIADEPAVSTPDLVRALAAALRVEPRLFAVPAGVLRIAGAAINRSEAVERLLGSLEVDTGAFRARFGWTPPVTLADGLAAACAGGAPL